MSEEAPHPEVEPRHPVSDPGSRHALPPHLVAPVDAREM